MGCVTREPTGFPSDGLASLCVPCPPHRQTDAPILHGRTTNDFRIPATSKLADAIPNQIDERVERYDRVASLASGFHHPAVQIFEFVRLPAEVG